MQVVAARSRNKTNAEWRYLKKQLGTRLTRPGQPSTVNRVSFARDCAGSCRGRGGTPHAKYFMFTNVGRYHVPNTVIQTSMNLTGMGYQGQWNQAEVSRPKEVYDHFMRIYRRPASVSPWPPRTARTSPATAWSPTSSSRSAPTATPTR